MVQVDETDLVYKGPWVRSAQQRLFQTLETDYSFPRATCRSLVNVMWDFTIRPNVPYIKISSHTNSSIGGTDGTSR